VRFIHVIFYFLSLPSSIIEEEEEEARKLVAHFSWNPFARRLFSPDV
jgi:hypothetical protein